jgi:hypothetical protein
VDTAPLVEKNKKKAEEVARQFDEMAARIRRNGDEKFGGALLLIPPDGVGEPISVLQLAGSNAGIFWSVAKQSIEEQFGMLAEKVAKMKAFGY